MAAFGNSGQVPDPVFFQQLDLCCQKIALKINDGDISEWTNGHYIRLSRLLLRETRVHLSENTLKRIFGKIKTPERYHPQKATRDALVQFIGYADWDAFVEAHTKEINPVPVRSLRQTAPSRRAGPIIARYVLLALAIIAGLFFIFRLLMPDPFIRTELVCRNPEGQNPHTAIFELDLPSTADQPKHNFVLDFNDGEQPQKLAPGQVLTHYYERPGRYFAMLKYGAQVLDTVPVYLKTGWWTATAHMPHDTTRVYPVEEKYVLKNEQLSVNTTELYRAGVDTNHTFFVDFNHTVPSTISGDNFELEARLKTSDTRAGVRCSQVIVRIFGEHARHAFTLMRPGCESWMYAYFSEKGVVGESSDLSALATDLRKGGVLKLTNRQRNVRLLLNNREIYQVKYDQPLGKIYGIQFSFTGIGTVYTATLKDGRTGNLVDLLKPPGLAVLN